MWDNQDNYFPTTMLGNHVTKDPLDAGSIDTSLCLKFANKISDMRLKVTKDGNFMEYTDSQSINACYTGVLDENPTNDNIVPEGKEYTYIYCDELIIIKNSKSSVAVLLFDVF